MEIAYVLFTLIKTLTEGHAVPIFHWFTAAATYMSSDSSAMSYKDT